MKFLKNFMRSSDKLLMLPLYYMVGRFFFYSSTSLFEIYLFRYFFGVVNNPGEFALKQAIAIGLTALYVCFFARFILNPIYRIEIKYKYDRRIEKAKQERRLLAEKANYNVNR